MTPLKDVPKKLYRVPIIPFIMATTTAITATRNRKPSETIAPVGPESHVQDALKKLYSLLRFVTARKMHQHQYGLHWRAVDFQVSLGLVPCLTSLPYR
ncbi:hypothetical protein E2C01_072533 [Portunus trituberculatus]|uniref:Uncharacterized protein n=1 Tax=Portunus trituberculatus TaxID=210409 RepID=A0A5B7I833_PORTR|nr:hypothetical protein [Portunus trituberculatus]